MALADLEVAMRAVLAAPPARRDELARRLLAEADQADQHRCKTGALHPLFGSGTLMSAAMQHPLVKRPSEFDATTLAAFANLINEIAEHAVHHKN